MSKALVGYESSDDENYPEESHKLSELLDKEGAGKQVSIVAAKPIYLASNEKQIAINVPYRDMMRPLQGADNPFIKPMDRIKNTYTGYAEQVVVSDQAFENQRRSFETLGYAVDPNSQHYVGDKEKAIENKGASLLDKPKRRNRRKRNAQGDPADVDGFKGPWAEFDTEDENYRLQEEARHEMLSEKYIEELKQKRKENLEALPVRKGRGGDD